jgi:hypothetical protein
MGTVGTATGVNAGLGAVPRLDVLMDGWLPDAYSRQAGAPPLVLAPPPPPASGQVGAAEVAAVKGDPGPVVVMEVLLGWLADGYSWQALTPAFHEAPPPVVGQASGALAGPVLAVAGWRPEGYNWQGGAPPPSPTTPGLSPVPLPALLPVLQAAVL